MRRCVASPLPRRPRHLDLAADNALLRSSDGHVTTFAHSLLCLCPHQHRLASQEVRVLVRAKSTAQTARAASNPIVVADLRAGQGCADCVGEQYGTDGLTCQACEPGKHPHADHTSCDDCSPVRPRQASAPDSPGNAPQMVAGCAGEGGRHGHVQKVQARQDAGGRQAVLHQVWRSVPQTRRARCAQRFCAHRAICCGQGKSRICW